MEAHRGHQILRIEVSGVYELPGVGAEIRTWDS